MKTRCAWCSRFRLDTEWVIVEEPPGFVGFGDVSHGICDDCVAELRSAGLSA